MNFETAEPAFRFHRGTRPLLLSIPHAGTHVPPALFERLSPAARALPDTDWHLERLYTFARELGASVLVATHSRYVIDLNRPSDGASLYPGQSVTGLCPLDTFTFERLYTSPETEPDEAEIAQRLEAVWRPYHACLAAELARLRQQHGAAALWDAHSIKSVLPRFFEGRLDDLNFGTDRGASCDDALARRLLALAGDEPGYSEVLNGRFTGGFITRHYGDPAQGVQAVQLEMTWRCYMDEGPPYDYLPAAAAQVQPLLRCLLEAVLAHVESAPA